LSSVKILLNKLRQERILSWSPLLNLSSPPRVLIWRCHAKIRASSSDGRHVKIWPWKPACLCRPSSNARCWTWRHPI
jgi:hypothetical protein